MDIHRCRFVTYPPSTINVLAFSSSQISKSKDIADLRLAIGRANGDIEIWNPLRGAWLQETIFRGGKDRSVDGLVWIRDPDGQDSSVGSCAGKLRLFSVGYTTTITEWDLERGQPLRQSSGNYGEIWCLAAQPYKIAASAITNDIVASEEWFGQNLITGCNDGAVVLYSTADDNLNLRRVLVRPSSKKAKVISIIFQDRNIVAAGCTDSTIRIYDIRTGALVRSLSLGAGPTGAPKEIVIWTIKCLPNGNIVSGDSTGEMCIWDGKTYTLMQRLKSHKHDILSIAISNDGSMIFSGGMDRRTIAYKQVGGPRMRWAEVAHKRFHSHDVKTMASFEGMGMSIVVSGGPDGSPIVLPLKEFGMEYQRMLPCLPQYPPLQSAIKERLLMSWWDREIYIWRINKTEQHQTGPFDYDTESETNKQPQKLVAKMLLKGEANINSASITPDGSLLAVATSDEIKVFHVQSSKAGPHDTLRIKKLEISSNFSAGGARLVQFSANSQWLGTVTRDSRVIIARIVADGTNSFKLHHTLSELSRPDRESHRNDVHSALGQYDRTVARIAFSSDSRILAVSDLAGFIDTWVLEEDEDFATTMEIDNVANDVPLLSPSHESDMEDKIEGASSNVIGQRWKRNPAASLLPRLPSSAVVLCFRPIPAAYLDDASDPASIMHPVTNNKSRLYQMQSVIDEDRLLVMTASGVVIEFNVMRGTLSAWSRRNPISSFPQEFRIVRDQAMGCIWDVGNSKQRLWLYGSSWIWMFDLSKDFPANMSPRRTSICESINGDISEPTELPSNKRLKSNNSRAEIIYQGWKSTSGAGGIIPDFELVTGISRKFQTSFLNDKGQLNEDVTDHRPKASETDLIFGDGKSGEGNLDFAPKHSHRDRDLAMVDGGRQLAKYGNDQNLTSSCSWHTYKYRPILGIVPLSNGEDNLEVVLVERPTWDMDLPPRYHDDQERER